MTLAHAAAAKNIKNAVGLTTRPIEGPSSFSQTAVDFKLR